MTKLLLLMAVAWAANTTKIGGELKAVTSDTIEVSDGKHIYVIKRAAVRTKSALKSKPGTHVEVEYENSGLVEAKDAPAPKGP